MPVFFYNKILCHCYQQQAESIILNMNNIKSKEINWKTESDYI